MSSAMKDGKSEWLEEQDFYELMHTYRHAQEWTKPTVVEAFEAVKAYIRERNRERDLA